LAIQLVQLRKAVPREWGKKLANFDRHADLGLYDRSLLLRNLIPKRRGRRRDGFLLVESRRFLQPRHPDDAVAVRVAVVMR
jgi:hypothetical protein